MSEPKRPETALLNMRERLAARIDGLVNRGREICPRFVPSDTRSCGVCGYDADVHLLSDIRAVLASQPSPLQTLKEWQRFVVSMPMREERLGGQRTYYVQRSTLLDYLEVEIEKADRTSEEAA